ncbi:hypothetical protein [Catenulispora sp. GAS73]|uniref:hypothetical protein n=1 Tax=Catenulispora sp. GAS73 TaxID=3156269 RepID=UPI0035187A19
MNRSSDAGSAPENVDAFREPVFGESGLMVAPNDAGLRHIREYGLESFWNLDWDCFDVTRPPAI